jgi:hypothetical protein
MTPFVYNPYFKVFLHFYLTGIVILPEFQKGRDIKASWGKKAGSTFGQKRAICVVHGKTDRISLLF